MIEIDTETKTKSTEEDEIALLEQSEALQIQKEAKLARELQNIGRGKNSLQKIEENGE